MIPKTEVDSNTALQGMNNRTRPVLLLNVLLRYGEFAPGNN